jgi:hypothetical protein
MNGNIFCNSQSDFISNIGVNYTWLYSFADGFPIDDELHLKKDKNRWLWNEIQMLLLRDIRKFRQLLITGEMSTVII